MRTTYWKEIQTLPVALGIVLAFSSIFACGGRSDRPRRGITGVVREAPPSAAPIPGARVTLFDAAVTVFEEVRTDSQGRYKIDGMPAGNYSLGASARGYEYQEFQITYGRKRMSQDFALGPDVHPGRWTVIGDTSPEYLGASNSGTLLSDGRILFCHDTRDPVIFDPVTGMKTLPSMSPSEQGCHMTTLLEDDRLIFVGGQDGPFTNAVATVKIYDPVGDMWTVLPDMGSPRWYPTLVRLADGRLLACGGGTPPAAARTDTCEILDPRDPTWMWNWTDSMANPSEYAPSALLRTGEVLLTWWPPQLFDPGTETWRPTGQFVQPDRGWPDHAPHSLVELPDGRMASIGIKRGTLPTPSMVEIFDPATEAWSLGATTQTTRSYPEVAALPTGQILCAGGYLEDNDPTIFTNAWGYTRLTDIYDPATDTWRRAADMGWAREYHALTLLIPDGRVIITAGTDCPACVPAENDVEAYEPPYLFRGIRPRIDSISKTTLLRGETLTLGVSRTRAITSVSLLGTQAVTHYVNGGVPRTLSLSFTQQNGNVDVVLPTDPGVLPIGHYLIFVLVDDIPSEGKIVKVSGP
ncbi:MAG: DUF1929 domain-containing protein [Planctomycetota bacterium]|nr:DUF1929 domain-containing protein [Planctomycetota bacterium]